MRLDLDTYKEILDTITRNKSRSLLTGFGVFWGVFMLIALMGGGQGLKEMLQNNFTGFATNTAIIWAQNTTKPYKGFNKGRSWQMEEKDLDRLRHQVPELDVITPLLFGHRCFTADTSTRWMCASSARFASSANRFTRISFLAAVIRAVRA